MSLSDSDEEANKSISRCDAMARKEFNPHKTLKLIMVIALAKMDTDWITGYHV